ncbi:HD-GYP domain-containing protein [Bacillus niameyensis]|uniref:HD-GYP domain-containing protein n=1 Tax=Bacillus niameyensis TaxID=1522308 RepID=UPI001E35B2E4|nr:HD domain-containing phosphohydrolase [Bacillus niameyensis]
MINVKVKVEELKEGSVLLKDVMGSTSSPIIPANTVLTEEHLNVLRAFLIKEVEVGNRLNSGKPFEEMKTNTDTYKGNGEDLSFLELYSSAVTQYKKEFQSWRSGSAINISKIRSFLIPLFKKSHENKDWLQRIDQFSNKQDYLYHHAIAVSLIASFIAKEMGYDNGQCLQIAMAGCLADCGMSKIDEGTIISTRSLRDHEWNEIKKHPIYSYQMLKDISLLKPESKLAIVQHHERLDGTGYPLGESGAKIQMQSQMIAIADIYHAMTANRLYMNKRSPFKTLQMMKEDQFGKLHISILQVLISAIAELPVGTNVILSDGRVGEIIFNKPNAKTRPLIKIKENNEMVDLEKHRQLYVQQVMN